MHDGEFREVGIVKIGAEAVIRKVLWRGLVLIAKTRIEKPYRHPELDRAIRLQRTMNEARVMVKSKRIGVPCPTIVHVSQTDYTIYMQYIEGPDLRELLTRDPGKCLEIAPKTGAALAQMHRDGMHHGDFVPSNVIISGSLPVLIDFGLSGFSDDIEDQAIDLHLLERSLRSGHQEVADEFMEAFKEGYASILGRERLSQVERRVIEIRRRARYVERAAEEE